MVVTALPLYHIFALMVNFICGFSRGAENWLVTNPRDMDGFVEILKQARCTFFTGVNSLYGGLVAHPRIKEVDFSRLRYAIGGGASVMPVTSARWKALTGRDIIEGYGLSETSPVLTLNPPNQSSFSATVGLPLPSTDIKLLDDDGCEVRMGEAGEVCAPRPQVMRGYWQKRSQCRGLHLRRLLPHGDISVFDARATSRSWTARRTWCWCRASTSIERGQAVAATCRCGRCACVSVPEENTGEAVSSSW